jgi:hypothetical protein
MEQCFSWEGNSRSAGKEISRLVWNLRVPNRIHKNLPLHRILSNKNQLHILTPYFLRSILILSFHVRLYLGFSDQNFESSFICISWSVNQRFSTWERQSQICHECVQLLILLEVPLQIHPATVFVLRTHFQISNPTSELSYVARTTTVPPPFSLVILPFDKVALAFM